MTIFIEKLARNFGEKVTVSFDEKSTAEETALAIVRSGTFDESLAEMGDVINVGNEKFLVEGDLTVTAIEQDEYAYYKNIDQKDRLAQWFGGSLN